MATGSRLPHLRDSLNTNIVRLKPLQKLYFGYFEPCHNTNIVRLKRG